MRSKTRWFGGLAVVSFVVTCACYLVGPQTVHTREDTKVRPVHSADAESDKASKTGVRLEIVSQEGCYACIQLRPEIERLKNWGYEVKVVSPAKSKRRVKKVPSLFYVNDDGIVIRKEIGFRKAEHMQRFLEKKEIPDRPLILLK